jgi:cell division protein FtsQ
LSVKSPPRPPEVVAEKKAKMDPRIRARRVEVQRTEGRKRLRRLGIVGIAVAVAALMWWLTLSPLLDVDAIRVHGATHTGDDAVLAALDVHRGDALLTADVGGAAAALSELPWVATATVRRAWPGTLDVTVVEREPVAAVAARGGGWVVVDRRGRELAVEKEPATELVRIAGHKVTPALGDEVTDALRGALDLAGVLPDSLRPAVPALWPQRDGTIEATVALPSGGTATARFGAADQLEAKLVSLAAVLERADLAGVRIIDLRVPSAPALTRG